MFSFLQLQLVLMPRRPNLQGPPPPAPPGDSDTELEDFSDSSNTSWSFVDRDSDSSGSFVEAPKKQDGARGKETNKDCNKTSKITLLYEKGQAGELSTSQGDKRADDQKCAHAGQGSEQSHHQKRAHGGQGSEQSHPPLRRLSPFMVQPQKKIRGNPPAGGS